MKSNLDPIKIKIETKVKSNPNLRIKSNLNRIQKRAKPNYRESKFVNETKFESNPKKSKTKCMLKLKVKLCLKKYQN